MNGSAYGDCGKKIDSGNIPLIESIFDKEKEQGSYVPDTDLSSDKILERRNTARLLRLSVALSVLLLISGVVLLRFAKKAEDLKARYIVGENCPYTSVGEYIRNNCGSGVGGFLAFMFMPEPDASPTIINTSDNGTDTSTDNMTETEEETTTEITDTSNISTDRGTDDETTADPYYLDRSQVKEGEFAILPVDLCSDTVGTVTYQNLTSLSADAISLLKSFRPDHAVSGDVSVLIIHTNLYDSYSELGATAFDPLLGELARSEDSAKNTARIGDAFADALSEYGIRSIHCTFNRSDSKKDTSKTASEIIRAYLSRYPTIKYVVDIRRGCEINENGDILRPVTFTDNGATAQVRAIVGSNEYTKSIGQDFKRNLSLSLMLRDRVNAVCPIFMPPLLVGSSLNQDLALNSLTLEIGYAGNYLNEAIKASEICGKAFAEMIA